MHGGVAKQFSYAACQTRSERDPKCAYYELTVSFDFAGTYKAHVMAFDNAATQLVPLTQEELLFEVKGLGEITVPVPELAETSISWADHLANRNTLGSFDTALAQTVRATHSP